MNLLRISKYFIKGSDLIAMNNVPKLRLKLHFKRSSDANIISRLLLNCELIWARCVLIYHWFEDVRTSCVSFLSLIWLFDHVVKLTCFKPGQRVGPNMPNLSNDSISKGFVVESVKNCATRSHSDKETSSKERST